MNAELDFERCLTFINSQLRPGRIFPNGAPQRRAVTISRQTGCGAVTVAQKLVEYFQTRSPREARQWAVFDRNLVEKVLEDHHLPKRLAKFMPEDSLLAIDDTIDELLGLHPPSWILVRRTAETILNLAELGNVILIGRGANVITRKLDYAFHIRLVGSLEMRLKRIQESNHLDAKAALQFIRCEDRGRARYLKKYFQKDIEDPLLYHLTINTDLVSCEDTARLIGNAVMGREILAARDLPAAC